MSLYDIPIDYESSTLESLINDISLVVEMLRNKI